MRQPTIQHELSKFALEKKMMMDIQFNMVKNPGVIETERVILNVSKDTDLGSYLIATSIENDDNKTITSALSNVYWLPDQKLKAGDLVVIYTKKGTKGKIENKDGSTSYFFYWGLDCPIGNDERATVVLFNADWWYRRIHPEAVKVDEYVEKGK